MNDLKDQTILISSVTHSEAVIQTIEKFSHHGLSNSLFIASSGVNRDYFACHDWRVAAS